MSSDDELPSPSQRAPRSKKTAPATPDEFESASDDAKEVETKVNRSYARLRVNWVRKLTMNKVKMDDDEAKEKINAGAREFMESSGLYKLPGQKNNRD